MILLEFGCKSIGTALHILVHQVGVTQLRYLPDGAKMCINPGVSTAQIVTTSIEMHVTMTTT